MLLPTVSSAIENLRRTLIQQDDEPNKETMSITKISQETFGFTTDSEKSKIHQGKLATKSEANDTCFDK